MRKDKIRIVECECGGDDCGDSSLVQVFDGETWIDSSDPCLTKKQAKWVAKKTNQDTPNHLGIVSYYRDEKYSVLEALQKGLDRSGLNAEEMEYEHLARCYYDSEDGRIYFREFGPDDSQWTASISWRFTGHVMVHKTPVGNVEFGGWGCASDGDGILDLSEGLADETDGEFSFYLGEQKETWKLSELSTNEKILFFQVIERYLVRHALK